MHSTRTAVLAMLVALLLPAPAVLAETAPPDRSKTAGPISAELAKKCRALAISRLISIVVLLLLGLAVQATAETCPERVVRIVNPYPPGGSVDVMARILAQNLTDNLGQQVIVENRSIST